MEAIEIGNCNKLPEPIYTQALIRLSADAIGLDGIKLANYFPTNVDGAISMSINQILIANPWNPFHIYLVYVNLIFCTVSSLSQLLSDSSLQAKKYFSNSNNVCILSRQ